MEYTSPASLSVPSDGLWELSSPLHASWSEPSYGLWDEPPPLHGVNLLMAYGVNLHLLMALSLLWLVD